MTEVEKLLVEAEAWRWTGSEVNAKAFIRRLVAVVRRQRQGLKMYQCGMEPCQEYHSCRAVADCETLAKGEG